MFSTSSSATIYGSGTDFTGTGFDPVAAGWTLVSIPALAPWASILLAAFASRRLSSHAPRG